MPTLYGSRWRKFREGFLARHPLCGRCQALGKVEASTEVHHVEPHRGDRQKFWSGPFEALCETCHARIGQIEDAGGIDPACGFDGWPLSPRHPWNKGKSDAP